MRLFMKKKTTIILVLILVFSFVSSFGKQSFAAGGSWKSNSSGWWYEYSDGSYAMGWTEIDGYWYYFLGNGYMDYSEYRDGCWLNADGSWNTAYSGGYWASDSTGWWYTDASGWYPVSTWLWIDGSCYYFKASGYMAVNETIDGYYVDASGKMTSSSGSTSNGAHNHTWVCTKEAWDEKVCTKDAWDEQVPRYEEQLIYVCIKCKTPMPDAGPCQCGCYDAQGKWEDVLVGYDTVHHDAEYTTVHHDAEYKCSTCGATK